MSRVFLAEETRLGRRVVVKLLSPELSAGVSAERFEREIKLAPSGTQPGKVLNLKGKGVPHLRGSGRGDEMVVIEVEIPSHMSAEQKRLFEELAHTLGSEVKPQDKSFLDTLKEVLGG